MRGYPNGSANRVNYVVAVDGALSLVYGTSVLVFGRLSVGYRAYPAEGYRLLW